MKNVLIVYHTVQLFNDLWYIIHEDYEYTIILFIEYYVLCICIYTKLKMFFKCYVIHGRYIFT